MQNIYLAIDVGIVISLIALAITGLMQKGYKSPINRSFTFVSIFIGLWILANNLSNDLSLPYTVALWVNYAVFAFSLAALISFMHLMVQLSNSKHLQNIIRKTMPLFWVMGVFCFTPLVVQNIIAEPSQGLYSIVFGALVIPYALEIFLIVAIIAFCIFHGLRSGKGMDRQQLKTISLGLFVSLPICVVLQFIVPLVTGSFATTEFGIASLVLLVISIYYAVMKFQLFDIRLAAVRTLTYVLTLLTLALAYCYLAFLISGLFLQKQFDIYAGTNIINIILALLLAFIFQPVKKFFDKVTNKIFYKDNYDSDDFLTRLNKVLAGTADLRGLLERAANEIGTTLKAEQAFFFINTIEDHFVTAGTEKYRKIPKYDTGLLEMSLDKGDNSVVITSLLDSADPIHRMMVSHKIELALPLVYNKTVLGFLFLGSRLTAHYTKRDIKTLETISNELVISIRNALIVNEIRELNTTLQQRINNATKELRANNNQLKQFDRIKDEFVSIASHQLRTPLTSVKGYLSMILEGDAGKISPRQRGMLTEAFNASERMVRLINDFLNLSRIQTGRFIIDKVPVDLSTAVRQEVDVLQPVAATRQIRLIYRQPKNIPLVNVDEDKIHQVIMNFIDNAIYYSHEDSSIKIKLLLEKQSLQFTVTDTGIGVPINEQRRLFTKFFRAGNAQKQRPDGTGIGLYLAKKVIDSHNGQLIFESKENKGSTFGFLLPIDPKTK